MRLGAALLLFMPFSFAVYAADTASAGLIALSDGDLGEVVGREGISLSTEFFMNAARSTNPLVDGGPISGLCTFGTLNDCKLSWQIEGRDDGYLPGFAGEWLVLKDFFLATRINDLNLDGAFLGDSVSALTGFFNTSLAEGRFNDQSGNCLLEGGCTQANLALMPALRTSFANSSGTYNPATGEVTGFNNFEMSLNIGRMAIETNLAGVEGFNRDANGSFLGLRMADNNGNFARAAVGGNFYLFGF